MDHGSRLAASRLRGAIIDGSVRDSVAGKHSYRFFKLSRGDHLALAPLNFPRRLIGRYTLIGATENGHTDPDPSSDATAPDCS